MDRPSIRRVAAVLVALTVGLTFAPVALACEVATTSVSFASAVGPARLVVVADVVSIPTGGRPGAFVLAVERTLRGASVSQLTIEAPYAGDLCEVSLAPGARVVLAMDDPSSLAVGTTTAWTVAPDGALTLDGLELLADGPSTFEALIARLAAPPATDTLPASTEPDVGRFAALVLLLAGLLGAGLGWWRSRRPAALWGGLRDRHIRPRPLIPGLSGAYEPGHDGNGRGIRSSDSRMKDMDRDDPSADLLERLRRHDERVLPELLRRHGPRIAATITATWRGVAAPDIEELVADVIAAGWFAADEVDPAWTDRQPE